MPCRWAARHKSRMPLLVPDVSLLHLELPGQLDPRTEVARVPATSCSPHICRPHAGEAGKQQGGNSFLSLSSAYQRWDTGHRRFPGQCSFQAAFGEGETNMRGCQAAALVLLVSLHMLHSHATATQEELTRLQQCRAAVTDQAVQQGVAAVESGRLSNTAQIAWTAMAASVSGIEARERTPMWQAVHAFLSCHSAAQLHAGSSVAWVCPCGNRSASSAALSAADSAGRFPSTKLSRG